MSDATLNSSDAMMATIASHFHPTGQPKSIEPLGNGNINDTYLVVFGDNQPQKFVLQRINQQVFRDPQLVMNNICHMEQHVCERLIKKQPDRRWELPRVARTQTGDHHVVDEQGSVWRAIAYIDSAKTYDSIGSSQLAYEVGVGLGTFHDLIHDLPLEAMVDTLEGFHITPKYLDQYDQICTQQTIPKQPLAQYCEQFIRDRRNWANVLEVAKDEGKLKLQPIHGDPKVNNVMIDTHTHKAVSLVDLDTVKPGLIHYDIGDCLRSGCNPLGEETEEFNQVSFDIDLCQAILKGYGAIAHGFLSDHDYDYLYDSIRLLAFELGLRFFSDHINHNQYFKAKHPTHNLNRAVVQFKLVESIEAQEPQIQALVNQLR